MVYWKQMECWGLKSFTSITWYVIFFNFLLAVTRTWYFVFRILNSCFFSLFKGNVGRWDVGGGEEIVPWYIPTKSVGISCRCADDHKHPTQEPGSPSWMLLRRASMATCLWILEEKKLGPYIIRYNFLPFLILSVLFLGIWENWNSIINLLPEG